MTKDRRKWVYTNYPKMVQVTKTQETNFEEFRDDRIQLINDDWSTPLDMFRKYQQANITLNMYFVDSPLMFSYAWCLGVRSVTTSHCKLLSMQTSNPLYDVSIASSNEPAFPLTIKSPCSYSLPFLFCYEIGVMSVQLLAYNHSIRFYIGSYQLCP